MAIAGLLVHTLPDHVVAVEAALQAIQGLTTYGIHEDQYLVVVAEAPAGNLEALVEQIEAQEGVLTVYTTYVTVEDELEHAPA